MPTSSSSPICERSFDLTLIEIGRRDIPQCSPKHFIMQMFYRTFSSGRRPSYFLAQKCVFMKGAPRPGRRSCSDKREKAPPGDPGGPGEKWVGGSRYSTHKKE